MRLNKSLNFGASVGDIIGGALARGEGGQFINAAELGALQDEALQQLYDALREAAGLPPDPDGLREEKEKQKKAPKARRSSSGRKKPKSRSRARRESQADRTARRKAEQSANRLSISSSLSPQGLSPGDLEQLNNFRSGGEASPESLARLTALGLTEIDQQGQPRMTSAGSSLIRAANRGDTRKALDSLSIAKDRIRNKEDRIERRDESVNEIQERNNILVDDINALQSELAGLEAELQQASKDQADQIKRTIARKTSQLERKQQNLNRNQNRIDSLIDRNQKDRQSITSLIKSFFRRPTYPSLTLCPICDYDSAVHISIKKHTGELIKFPCPECGHNQAKVYKDHNGLYVCQSCSITYDPSFYQYKTV